jgi:acetylornithine aminotransferase
MPNYARLPVTFSRGDGAWLYDNTNKRYLDAISGIAVCSLGHSHPAITAAICEQANTLLHTSNLYGIEAQNRLADALTKHSGMDTAFFANSGAEANETAIKMARLWGDKNGIKNPAIIVMENSFHGRTLATLSASGNRKVQAGFEPLVQGFLRVPYNDIQAIRDLIAHHHNIVAILVEPVQGEGGVQIPDPTYLPQLRTICTEQRWLLMLDEVQTGIGRCGHWFAYQQYNILPDVLTSAKALGNGIPIGACLASGEAAHLMSAGKHGSTFGGNPLSCHVALAVLNTIQQDNLLQRANVLGELFSQYFQQHLQGTPGVVSIRGQGLLLGIELDRPCGQLVTMALEKNLLINVASERVVRLLPPLILSDNDTLEIAKLTVVLIKEFLSLSDKPSI